MPAGLPPVPRPAPVHASVPLLRSDPRSACSCCLYLLVAGLHLASEGGSRLGHVPQSPTDACRAVGDAAASLGQVLRVVSGAAEPCFCCFLRARKVRRHEETLDQQAWFLQMVQALLRSCRVVPLGQLLAAGLLFRSPGAEPVPLKLWTLR